MELVRTSPSDAGVDASGITAFLQAQERDGHGLHSIMVLKGHQLIAEGWAGPYTPESVQLCYSLSKTFTSVATGIAVAEGKFSYDSTLVELFPDLARDDDPAGPVGPKARSIRIRDCLGMATGHTAEVDFWRNALTRESVGLLLRPEPQGEVGRTFCYNQMAPFSCAKAVEQAYGMSVLELLQQRIFDHLGIEGVLWFRDLEGGVQGFSGIHVATEHIARFFRLIADDGVHDGQQLIPAEWIHEHRRVQTQNAIPGATADWAAGYGWQVWIATHGYRGDGAYGQFGIILPEQDVVVAITSEDSDLQGTLDNLWEHVLPALDRPGSAEADAHLASALDDLWFEPLGDNTPLPTLDVDDGLGGRLQLDNGTLTWTDDTGETHVLAVGEGEWAFGRLDWASPGHNHPAGGYQVAVSAGPDPERSQVDDVTRIQVLCLNSPHQFSWWVAEGQPTRFAWRLEPLGSQHPRQLAVR